MEKLKEKVIKELEAILDLQADVDSTNMNPVQAEISLEIFPYKIQTIEVLTKLLGVIVNSPKWAD